MNLGSAFSMLTHFETAAFAMTGLVMEYKELEGQAARAVDAITNERQYRYVTVATSHMYLH